MALPFMNPRERIGFAELVPLGSLRSVRKFGSPLLAAGLVNKKEIPYWGSKIFRSLLRGASIPSSTLL
jgi:hypothetical protein